MSDLNEGWSSDGVAVDSADGFDAALAEAAKSESSSSGSSEPQAPEDPALTTGQEIVRGLLGEGPDPLKFEVKGDKPSTEVDRSGTIEGENVQEVWDTLGVAATQLEEAQELLQGYRDDEIASTFDADLEEALGTSQIAEALAEAALQHGAGELSEETFVWLRQQALKAFADELYASGMLDVNDEGEYEPGHIEQVSKLLDMEAAQAARVREVEELDARIEDAIPAAAEQRAGELKAALTLFARKQGITDKGLLEWRVRNAEESYRAATGGRELSDLVANPSVPIETFLDTLSEHDAMVGGAVKVQRDQDFQAQVLGAGGGTLSEGLTINGRPTLQHQLPPPSIEKLNNTVEAFKARNRNQDRQSVAANFADPPSMKEGWTKAGKSVKQQAIDGSEAMWDRDEARRRESARGI